MTGASYSTSKRNCDQRIRRRVKAAHLPMTFSVQLVKPVADAKYCWSLPQHVVSHGVPSVRSVGPGLVLTLEAPR